VPLPRGLSYLLAWPFAADRMDMWVLIGSIAFVVLCAAALGLWHLIAYLAGKLPKKPRTVKDVPEPPEASQSSKLRPRVRVPAQAAPTGDDLERLHQACTALEDSLSETYLELAESWLRRGEPQKAAIALKKILQVCPDRHQARLAQERLLQIGHESAPLPAIDPAVQDR
jgi:hypothetical protein